MAEIRLELNLARASGVLAGIVAALAQAGLELRFQRLARATDGRGGTLDMVLDGVPPEPGDLVTMMEAARGVDRLMRIEIDGEAVLAEGRVLEDIMDADSLAALSAGQAPEAFEPETCASSGASHATGFDSAPETESESPPWQNDDGTGETFNDEAEPPEADSPTSSKAPEWRAKESTVTASNETPEPAETTQTIESHEPPEPPQKRPSAQLESSETTPVDTDPVRVTETLEPADPNRTETALRRRRRRRR